MAPLPPPQCTAPALSLPPHPKHPSPCSPLPSFRLPQGEHWPTSVALLLRKLLPEAETSRRTVTGAALSALRHAVTRLKASLPVAPPRNPSLAPSKLSQIVPLRDASLAEPSDRSSRLVSFKEKIVAFVSRKVSTAGAVGHWHKVSAHARLRANAKQSHEFGLDAESAALNLRRACLGNHQRVLPPPCPRRPPRTHPVRLEAHPCARPLRLQRRAHPRDLMQRLPRLSHVHTCLGRSERRLSVERRSHGTSRGGYASTNASTTASPAVSGKPSFNRVSSGHLSRSAAGPSFDCGQDYSPQRDLSLSPNAEPASAKRMVAFPSLDATAPSAMALPHATLADGDGGEGGEGGEGDEGGAGDEGRRTAAIRVAQMKGETRQHL